MWKDKEISQFRKRLLRWYDESQRQLPWRSNPSLYKTVISEFMLQQTQVATVLPYFERWTKRFPDFKSLAKAREETVLKHWEGLGYYNRARNLHKLAKDLAARNQPPTSLEEWLELPGIGPYTAAAITSIAQNQANPVVDGNVVRVLTRLSADGTLFNSQVEAQKKLVPMAGLLISSKRPGDYNQALMELGALLCKPSAPACLLCPVQALCQAYAQGNIDRFPNLPKRKVQKVTIERLWHIENEKILLYRTPDNSKRLAGIYELPDLRLFPNLKCEPKPFLNKKRGISNQAFTELIFKAAERVELSPWPKELKWVPLEKLANFSLSGPHRSWIEAELK